MVQDWWDVGVLVLVCLIGGELVLVCALAIFTNGTTIERKYTNKMREEPIIRTFVHIYANIGSKRSRTTIGSDNLCIFVQFALQGPHLSKKLGRNAQLCREADFWTIPRTAPATSFSIGVNVRDCWRGGLIPNLCGKPVKLMLCGQTRTQRTVSVVYPCQFF